VENEIQVRVSSDDIQLRHEGYVPIMLRVAQRNEFNDVMMMMIEMNMEEKFDLSKQHDQDVQKCYASRRVIYQ